MNDKDYYIEDEPVILYDKETGEAHYISSNGKKIWVSEVL